MKQTEKQKTWKQRNYEDNKDFFREQQTKRRNEIRVYVESFKEKCEICPEKDVASLDFHHNDSTEKEDTLSNAIKNKWGKKRIDEEISKCTIICSNCHRKLHYYELTIDELKERYNEV